MLTAKVIVVVMSISEVRRISKKHQGSYVKLEVKHQSEPIRLLFKITWFFKIKNATAVF